MGWCKGSSLANGIWDEVRHHIPEGERRKVAQKLVGLLEDMDWDTQNESPLLMADGGLDYWLDTEDFGYSCGNDNCPNKAVWRGTVGNLSVKSCNKCVIGIEGPVLLYE